MFASKCLNNIVIQPQVLKILVAISKPKEIINKINKFILLNSDLFIDYFIIYVL